MGIIPWITTPGGSPLGNQGEGEPGRQAGRRGKSTERDAKRSKVRDKRMGGYSVWVLRVRVRQRRVSLEVTLSQILEVLSTCNTQAQHNRNSNSKKKVWAVLELLQYAEASYADPKNPNKYEYSLYYIPHTIPHCSYHSLPCCNQPNKVQGHKRMRLVNLIDRLIQPLTL